MPRKQVNLKLATYILVDKARGNKTFDKIIHETFTNSRKLKEENSRLKLEIEKGKVEAINNIPVSHPHTPPQPSPQIITTPLDYECHYRAYNPKTGKYFCDAKEIDPYVCMNRHGRFAAMERRCYPKGMKFRRRKKPRSPQDKEEWFSKAGEPFKGHEASGLW